MKKHLIFSLVLFGLGVALTLFWLKNQLHITPPDKYKITKNLCYKLVNDMENDDYYLYSYGPGRSDNLPKLDCFLLSNTPFKIQTAAEFYLKSYDHFFVLLNESKLVDSHGGKYSRDDFDFIISWNADPLRVDKTTYGKLRNLDGDVIWLKYYDASLNEIDKDIPYAIFKQLVEEKRFDEILHYGE